MVSGWERDVEWEEDKLFAMRTLCLIRLRVSDQEDEKDKLLDTYGEGDDDIIRLLQDFWEFLAGEPKGAVVDEYRRLSELEVLTHNKRGS